MIANAGPGARRVGGGRPGQSRHAGPPSAVRRGRQGPITVFGTGRQKIRRERLDKRIRGLAKLSDEQLIAEVPANNTWSYPWHEMEMQRRLKDAIQAQTKEAARSRVWAAWGSAVIALLTLALVGLTVVLAVRN